MKLERLNTIFFAINIMFCLNCFSTIKAQSVDTISVDVVVSDTMAVINSSESQISEGESFSNLYKNNNDPCGKKIFRGSKLALGFGVMIAGILEILPERISKWEKDDKWNRTKMKNNFISAYTNPPVIDHDLWLINYIGHPYQGGFYYNNIRSQGANIWTSSVYCLGQSLVWEYVLESSFERPSIQDLITTPIGGVIIGELAHIITFKMSKNGFNTLEKIVVCVINPSYAINNGLKTTKMIKY